MGAIVGEDEEDVARFVGGSDCCRVWLLPIYDCSFPDILGDSDERSKADDGRLKCAASTVLTLVLLCSAIGNVDLLQ